MLGKAMKATSWVYFFLMKFVVDRKNKAFLRDLKSSNYGCRIILDGSKSRRKIVFFRSTTNFIRKKIFTMSLSFTIL